MKSYHHEIGSFTGKGGVEIYFQKWIAEKAKAVLIIVHGLGEHSGRYGNLLKSFDNKGISFFAIDHRGHGKSDGKRGHIDSFMDYVYDLKLFVEFVKDENRGLPIILYGHSMGGIIASKYAMTYQDDLSMLVLSSPGFEPAFKVPEWKNSIAAFFSSRIASLTFSNGLAVKGLSHDAKAIEEYEKDPLVHGKITARWAVEFFRACKESLNNAVAIKKPLLVFHGKGDPIVDYKASEEFYTKASSAIKKLFIYEGLYHETINELEADREKVLNDVTEWILKNIGASSSAKKAPEKKAPSKKPAAKKPAVKKAAPKKPVAKKAPAKKAANKKPAPKKK
ncbi:MAG: lysophospholipase [Leptospirales bacterium]|nr:lysophospholipase [Leptospirales bacterium]